MWPLLCQIWIGPIPIEGVSGFFLLLPCFFEIPVFNANRVDPDQMPHSAATDLGLHCLPKSLLWDTGHKLVQALITTAANILNFLNIWEKVQLDISYESSARHMIHMKCQVFLSL